MTTRRVVVCLDVQGGRVVKGVRFKGLRDVGDPVELAARYQREGADEIVFLDISATAEERAPLWEIATRTAEQLFIPLVLGGGLAWWLTRNVDRQGRGSATGLGIPGMPSAGVIGSSVTRSGETPVYGVAWGGGM